MLKFKTIRYKNFLSTGNQFTELELDKTRTSLMIGTNGAGKSTMMDAISFGLFGRPFRKIKLGQLVNSINNKNCVVEVEFETSGKTYVIKRHLKPNKFEIYVDGKLSDQNAAARDQQDFLERYILKMNEKSFRQIVVLGNGSFTPFMRLSAVDRRGIIEELLDIQIFSVMNDLVKGRISDNKTEIVEIRHSIDLLERTIELQEQSIENAKVNKASYIKNKKSEVARNNDNIISLNEQIAVLQSKVGDFNANNNKKVKLTDFRSQFQSKIQTNDKQSHLVSSQDECPACKQGITDEHRERVVSVLDNESVELNEALDKVNDQITDVNNRLSEINDIHSKINLHQNNIVGIGAYISSLHKDIEDTLEEEIDIINNDEINDNKNQLDTKNESKYSLHEEKHTLNTVQELLRDSGIKTVIIKNYLPVINQLINKYLTSLNFFINFELDENFNETIKSRGRDKFAYGSFSEGEKTRIDLALLFTWREIARIKSSVSTNLLILDEIFDGSLDNGGIEDFLGILNSEAGDVNAFVISHKGDSILDKFGRVIQMEKVKNFSKIKVS